MKSNPVFTYIQKNRVIQHLLYWISILFFFSVLPSVFSNQNLKNVLIHNLYYMPGDIIAVYSVLYFGITKMLLKNKILGFFVITHIFISFTVGFSYFVSTYLISDDLKPQNEISQDYQWFSSILTTYIVIGSAAILKILKAWYKNLQEKLQLENQNIKSELALLRSQINPHFLFNTLNNIDSLTYSDQEKASESIIKLSEIMRYMLYESNADRVSLEKEVEYLESYVHLMRLRIKDPNFINFKIKGDLNNIYIPPMIFAPFIENAFKHADKKGVAPGIIISLKVKAKELYFYTANYYVANNTPNNKSGGIGLCNIRRRLDLIYKSTYDLQIFTSNNLFEIILKIPTQ